MNALETVRKWLEAFPQSGVLSGFQVDYTDKIPGTGGIMPDGLVEVRRSRDTIVDLLEGGINFIIDGINAFIRGVNKAFALIGALTGRSVSIDTLPRVELPRLAAGAVIPPNKEFLAVLGDQKQGTNIETPLDTMVQAFRQALSEGGYSGQSTAYLVIDEDILGKVVYRLNKSESNRVGVSLEDY